MDDNENDYQREAYLARFRRDHPEWSEEEIQDYHDQYPT